MTRDRRCGADDTSSAAGGTRADRLGAVLRANLKGRKARVRALAARGGKEGTAPAADKPREPAAED